MRPVQVVTGATGPSGWVPIDYIQKAFAIGFHCTVGGATAPSMTYKVQHAFSSGVPDTEVLITRSTTTATLVFKAVNGTDGNAWVNHGLSTSDNIEVAGASVNTAGTYVQRLYVGDHPIVTGATGSSDGNYAYPPNKVRTNITTYGSGSLTLSLNQGI